MAQATVDVNDLVGTYKEMLGNVNAELAMAVARGRGLERKVEELEKRVAELTKGEAE